MHLLLWSGKVPRVHRKFDFVIVNNPDGFLVSVDRIDIMPWKVTGSCLLVL